jgi:hypothetical protein
MPVMYGFEQQKQQISPLTVRKAENNSSTRFEKDRQVRRSTDVVRPKTMSIPTKDLILLTNKNNNESAQSLKTNLKEVSPINLIGGHSNLPNSTSQNEENKTEAFRMNRNQNFFHLMREQKSLLSLSSNHFRIRKMSRQHKMMSNISNPEEPNLCQMQRGQ